MSFGSRNSVGLGLGGIPSLRSSFPYAALDANFVTSQALPSWLTFARSGNESYFNSSAALVVTGTDVPNFNYSFNTPGLSLGLLVQPARTNSIRNNTMAGAAAGTPGTLPTNWAMSGAGLTLSVVSSGTLAGINYVDLRWSGTTGGTVGSAAFESNTQIAAASGQQWSQSVYLGIIAGSFANVSSIFLNSISRTSVGGFVANHTTGNLSSSLSSTIVRITNSLTLTGGGTVAVVVPAVQMGWTSGVAVDFTLRIGLPEMELGSFATTPIATGTAAVTRNADVATVTLAAISDVLVQDRNGGAWITGVPAGSYNLVPRTGQGVIAAWAAYPAGTAARYPGMAIAYA